MKKITFSLVVVALSFNAFAIENGTSVNWNEYNDFLKLYSSDKAESCSGTLIAGKYVLTAAHCLMNSRNPIAQIKNATGQEINIIAKNTHPDYYNNENGGTGNWHDVAISELSNYVDTQQIHFFADLTKNTIKLNDNLRVFGFGRTYEELNYADFTMIDIGKELDSVYGKMIDKGNTAPGDSGGAWLKNNAIVSVHKGSKTSTHYPLETYSTNLHYSNEFIREKVDGWHYPTLANTSNGKATITVQSLHLNSYSDAAYESGDVFITGGTCRNATNIQPFSICTYEVESQGGVGTLHLSDSESIIINKPAPTIIPESGGGDSGGSLGILSLFALIGLGFCRRKVTL